MSSTKAWISACRPKTLPLALSGIILGSFLSYSDIYSSEQQPFNWKILLSAILTATFLQILSNLANDYGDAETGADIDRIGPTRAVQSGSITKQKMKFAIGIFIVLSLISGLSLLYYSLWPLDLSFILFFVLGVLAIFAAIKYTIGKNPYGYRALGDIFVFLFFGWVAVLGIYFLNTKTIDLMLLLPASSVGLFSMAVLNLNNMRDVENDSKVGKNTLVVLLGIEKAKKYHYTLIITGLTLALGYVILRHCLPYGLIFCMLIPIFLTHLIRTNKNTGIKLEPELKIMALLTFFFTLLLGIGCTI